MTPVGWFYPFHTPGVAELEAACHRGGVTLHGTGIHPGGITELLPLTISSLCRNVRHVRAEEFSDIRVYRAELVVKEIMLFGKRPEDAEASPMLDLLGVGFGQSIDMLAAALGFRLDPEKRGTHEMAVATAPIDDPGRRARHRHRRGAALHLAGHRRRHAGHHRAGQLAHGRARTSIRRGRSAASASRSRSTATRRSTSTFRGLQPDFETADLDRNPGDRRHRHALRELDPLRRARPRRASAPTSTCR